MPQPQSIADRFEQHKQDYRAARQTRFRPKRFGVPHLGAGPDYHYRSETDYLRMVEDVRAMERDDVVTAPLLATTTRNTVQCGFSPDPATGDDGVDLELFNRWSEWAADPDQCDVAGESDFHAMEALVFRSMQRDGDVFAFLLEEGQLELHENHRCRSPSRTKKNIVHGVELDERRRRLRYWFTKDELDPYRQTTLKVSDLTSRPARDANGNRMVAHVYHPKRVSQTRGVTAFSPIFDAVGMHDDIEFSTMVRAQVASCFAVLEQTLEDWATPEPGTFGVEAQETVGGNVRTLSGIAPGMHIMAPRGHTLNMSSPQVPAPEFFPHVKLILTLIGINLGVPLVLFLMDASETNFSGWRGAFDQAKLGFEENQKALAARFHRNVWRWRAMQAAADDKALLRAMQELGPAYFRHGWNFPKWPYIEPLKDAQADLLQVRNALNSPRRIQAARGRDWEKVAAEIVTDNGLAIELAIKEAKRLNAMLSDGEKVHWREIISLPTPDGVQVALNSQEQQQPQNTPAGSAEKPK